MAIEKTDPRARLAGTFFTLAGFFHVVQGIVGLADNNLYATNQYAFQFNAATWGWVHIVLGVGVLAIGLALLLSVYWARSVAVGLAMISIGVNFLWLPYYPWWAMLVIVLDFLVIWALHVRDRDTTID